MTEEKTYFVETISAGASVAGKLFLNQYESISPYFAANVGLKVIGGDEEGIEKTIGRELTKEELIKEIQELQAICRQACEDKMDEDIADIKGVKLFQQVMKAKGRNRA